MGCSTPSFPVLHYPPEFIHIHVHWVGDIIQPSHPLSPLLLPSDELALCIRWPKYWSFSFSISPSSEYSELISFRIDWVNRSSCCPRNSQESSPAPQFKSINSLALSLLYGPTLESVRDWWKKPQLWLYRPLLAKWYLCFLICYLGWS